MFENIYQEKAGCGGSQTRPSNLYLIRGEPRSLLIDTGFATAESQAAVLGMLRELQIPLSSLDVFLTHNHPDHAGLAPFLAAEGARMLMKREEKDTCAMLCGYFLDSREESLRRLRQHGWNEKEAQWILQQGRQEKYRYNGGPGGKFPFTDVRPGERLRYGGYTLEVVDLAGHTPHQIGLADRQHRWLFLGDTLSKRQVLILSAREAGENLLSKHLRTLERLETEFADFWMIPTHYAPFYGPKKAAENTRRYFAHILEKCAAALEEGSAGKTLAQVLRMVFRYTEHSVLEEEMLRLHFRLSNTLACLDELVCRGLAARRETDGVWFWEAVQPAYFS